MLGKKCGQLGERGFLRLEQLALNAVVSLEDLSHFVPPLNRRGLVVRVDLAVEGVSFLHVLPLMGRLIRYVELLFLISPATFVFNFFARAAPLHLPVRYESIPMKGDLYYLLPPRPVDFPPAPLLLCISFQLG